MSKRFLLPLFFLYLLLGRVLPFSFAITVVNLSSWRGSHSLVFPLVLLVGILESVAHVQPLGLLSFGFVAFALAITLTRTKFELDSLWWVVIAAGIGEILYAVFLGQSITAFQVVVQMLVTVLLWLFLNRFSVGEGVYLRK